MTSPARQRRAAARPAGPRSPAPSPAAAAPAFDPTDRHALYELCAQNPPRDAALLHAIRLDGPRAKDRPGLILAEDFCGTAALSRAWCAMLPAGRAIGVDLDAPTLARARATADASPARGRIDLLRADLIRASRLPPADLIAVQNFSIGEIHERGTLVAYLRRARARLRPGGCFVCDVYGGSDAFITGVQTQRVAPPLPPAGPPRGTRVMYGWEQRLADPFTGRVENAMHFEVTLPRARRGGPRRIVALHDAFVYRWRLWSVPELRDAMAEAGFGLTQVYPRVPGAIDQDGRHYVHPVDDPLETGDAFNVYVVARR